MSMGKDDRLKGADVVIVDGMVMGKGTKSRMDNKQQEITDTIMEVMIDNDTIDR